MNTRLGAFWRTAWPFAPETPVLSIDTVWRQFSAAAKTGPVLYSITRSKGLLLHAGDSDWALTEPDATGARSLEHAGKSSHQDTKHLLEAWLSTRPQQTPQGRRGFCPTVELYSKLHLIEKKNNARAASNASW
jgi:hypothetical protein